MMRSKKWLTLFFLIAMATSITLGLIIYSLCTVKPVENLTLTTITHYAQDLPEYPLSDDNDWEDPRFESYYESRSSSLITNAFRAIGLWRQPAASPRFMSSLMKEITAYHRQQGLLDGKNSFIHIKAHEPKKIIIFGDLHGAFHSLLRDLNHLFQKGILSNDLNILDPDTYIIFNGDAIDRSAYNIDTLIVLCLLMRQNPNQVFYLGGKHERDAYWLDFGLRRELFYRGKYYSKQWLPFEEQVINFFQTLPEAVYISGKDDKHDVIRISFNDREHLKFDESSLDTSFLDQKSNVRIHNYSRWENSQPFDVRAVVKTEDWHQDNRIVNGLGLLNQNQGATNWAVLSSPLAIHRIFLGFYDDAFATIDVDKYVFRATITLSHQDTRKMNGFITEYPLNIVSARQASQMILTDKEIKIGSTMSLIRGLPSQAKQLKTGADTRINEFNRNKNEKESTIRFYVKNDDYIPNLARKNALDYLNLGIRFFLLSLGTPTLSGYLDMLKLRGAAIFFPATGSESLRKPELSHVVHFRASFEDEARMLIRALKTDNSATKFTIFYQDDAFGRGAFNAALEELKKMGITDVQALPYTRGSVSFHQQAAQITKNIPDALGFFSTATAAKELIRQVGIGELIPPKLFGISDLTDIQMKKFLNRKGLSMLIASPVPNPHTSMLPIAQNFRKAMNKNNNLIDVFSFEAYIATSLFLEALTSIKSSKPTPKQVIEVIEKMKNYNFHGIRLNFNPKTRSLAKDLWIETDDASEWKPYSVE